MTCLGVFRKFIAYWIQKLANFNQFLHCENTPCDTFDKNCKIQTLCIHNSWWQFFQSVSLHKQKTTTSSKTAQKRSLLFFLASKTTTCLVFRMALVDRTALQTFLPLLQIYDYLTWKENHIMQTSFSSLPFKHIFVTLLIWSWSLSSNGFPTMSPQ